jgi:hypothetical protein
MTTVLSWYSTTVCCAYAACRIAVKRALVSRSMSSKLQFKSMWYSSRASRLLISISFSCTWLKPAEIVRIANDDGFVLVLYYRMLCVCCLPDCCQACTCVPLHELQVAIQVDVVLSRASRLLILILASRVEIPVEEYR